MGAPEQPLSRGFEAGSPAPDVELAPVDPSAQCSAARPAPEQGAGCRGRRGAWLSDSFILRRPAVLGREEGRGGSRE